MNIIQKPSPNCNSREGHAVDMLVLHYTGMASATAALERLCDAAAEVSAHYMVDEDGTIYQLVPEDMRAWHAGKAPLTMWRGYTNVNQRSIGIEIVNPGHEFGYRPFPKVQMEAVAELCKAIVQRHSIPARNVVGHSDVAPTRKEDPGELFDWRWLAGQGVGLWPLTSPSPAQRGRVGEGGLPQEPSAEFAAPAPSLTLPRERERGLEEYGYSTNELPKAILAFQRHFRPTLLTGQWDGECAGLLASLLSMV